MRRAPSPAAEALQAAITARPLVRIVAFEVDGVTRLRFSAREVGRYFYGPPTDDAEVRNQQDRVVAMWKRGEIAGEMTGQGLVISGAALADYLDRINQRAGDAAERKTA